MKLYSSTTSPFARKARVVIIEKGLSERVDEVFLKTAITQPNSELMAVNPLGKIPCLVNEDGQAIFDSRVICQYLDYEEHGHGASLHPSGNVRHKTLMALVDGALDAAVAMIYEVLIRPEDKQYPPIMEAQWGKVKNAIQFAETEYFDMLDRMNMGAIGLVCLLEYLDFRFSDRNWREFAPILANWHEEMKERESFVATRPLNA